MILYSQLAFHRSWFKFEKLFTYQGPLPSSTFHLSFPVFERQEQLQAGVPKEVGLVGVEVKMPYPYWKHPKEASTDYTRIHVKSAKSRSISQPHKEQHKDFVSIYFNSKEAIRTCLSALLPLSSSNISRARILRSVLPSRSVNLSQQFE